MMPTSYLLHISNLIANGTTTISEQKPGGQVPELSWVNIAAASGFILINGVISLLLGLKLEKSLFIAAIRCLVQLTIMGYILEDVFRARQPGLVFLMSFVLIILGSYETVYNKAKQSYPGMFLSVLLSTGCSTLLIGVIGSKWAMAQSPFWLPETFIPVMGMLVGNVMSGMAVALSSCLSSVGSHKEHIETYLAFGASRWEAGQSVAVEAVRLAMLPTINQMSVIGLISIPGMMTGQILGGAPVMNAVRYQQIIMFLISASTALGVLSAVAACIRVMIDRQHRLRPERIVNGRASIFRDIKSLFISAWKLLKYLVCCCRPQRKDTDEDYHVDHEDQRQPLLDN
ncbi:uncharacterized protein BYT42DRAFT_245001 [Radiomyces spectabilis]|uniref:uncharacterized protein n=1 Tax=Radiomyces spectabilis TaxID=64574 RepID=UPI00221E5678|nr:uncharacterized protein BYT42DRAFT_245001 [Radiomyces spectabilis]KAI8388735.1 hypothetical protein BYT42DRAFT_245001 [Radiomyces spectabilis]